MGAEQFYVRARAKSAQEAFNTAVREAQYENGHGGYTGTIAEKNSFLMLMPPEGVSPKTYAEWVENGYDGEWVEKHVPEQFRKQVVEDNEKTDSKWGPAACVLLTERPDGKKEFCFFGWASA